MIITIASFKGGVGKTTTSVHLACYLQRKANTLLVDGDPNRAVTEWNERKGLPCSVVTEKQMAKHLKDFSHVVIDTEAHPSDTDLKDLAEGCDLLILPSTPDALSLGALQHTVERLQSFSITNYKVLLAICPPRSPDVREAREWFTEMGWPAFTGEIRRFVAFQKAALKGLPVYQVSDPYAQAAWNDYRAVGKEIL
ncbi:MAG: ParA family protein [Acidobacteria bacterium]|nr:ParA family protein [Acidobacteriota bacterium]